MYSVYFKHSLEDCPCIKMIVALTMCEYPLRPLLSIVVPDL